MIKKINTYQKRGKIYKGSFRKKYISYPRNQLVKGTLEAAYQLKLTQNSLKPDAVMPDPHPLINDSI